MTTDAVGGIWTYGLDLARGLTLQGASVTLAVLGPGLDDGRRAQAEAAGLTVIDTGCAPEWLARDAAEIAATARVIAALTEEVEADLLHLNHPALAGCATFSCRTVGVAHSCVATWWEAVRGTALPADFAWRTAIVAKGYRAVAALVAPSRAFAAATQRAYHLPDPPVVVRNGRRAVAAPTSGQNPVRAVFSAGRLWDEGKNIAALDRAAATLPCRVRVAGPIDGPNGSRIALTNVESLGVLSEAEIAQQLAARPIYASPAFYEPFGLAVVEAAQAGCALVLSDIATFRELWEGAAVLVPPHDDRALVGAIEMLLEDSAGRVAIGEAARQRASSYDLGSMVDGTIAVHQGVLDRSARAFGMSAA